MVNKFEKFNLDKNISTIDLLYVDFSKVIYFLSNKCR